MKTWTLLLPLLLGACANHIDGDVDGYVPRAARDAVFDQVDFSNYGLGDLTVTEVLVTNASPACEAWDALQDIDTAHCTDYCQGMQDFLHDYGRGDSLWMLAILLGASGDLVGDYQPDWLESHPFGASFSWTDTTYFDDYDECVASCEDRVLPDTDSYSAKDGSVTVEEYEEGELVEGSYTLEFDDGELEGSFKAGHCDLE